MGLSRRWLVMATLGAAFAGACAFDLEGYSGGVADGGAPDATGTEAGPSDAGADVPSPGNGCPSEAGPAMVRVDAGSTSFCIDSTEVTKADYAAFLTAKGGDVTGQPSSCAWNKSYVPSDGFPNLATEADHPINYVNWCDAYAYCAWAGKRLCGKIGGGTNNFDDYENPAMSQWFAACSQSGAHAYPYGDTYDQTKCHTGEDAGGPTSPVASKPDCVGGVAGLFDMIGNVEEWEDSCTPAPDSGPPSHDICRHRGGALDDSPPTTSCAGTVSRTATRDFDSDSKGVRCCWP